MSKTMGESEFFELAYETAGSQASWLLGLDREDAMEILTDFFQDGFKGYIYYDQEDLITERNTLF